MRRFLYSFLALGTLLLIVALDCWIFEALFHESYLQWYIKNGTLIGLVTSVVLVSWPDLNKNLGLIASEPLDYLGSVLLLAGLPLQALGSETESMGAQMQHASSRMRRETSPSVVWATVLYLLPDAAFGIPLILLLAVALLAWLIFIAPVQYFVFLICGAPVRLLLRSNTRIIARRSEKTLEVKHIPREETAPTGWWDASFASSPVSFTSLLAAFLLFVLKNII